MTAFRFAAFALVGLCFAGCHDDPEVIEVLVPAANSQALAITASGGDASATPGPDGDGGAGGTIAIQAYGDLRLGDATSAPAQPSTPSIPSGVAPSTLAASVLSSTPGTEAGTLVISGSVTTAAADVTVGTLNGDIVVSGTIRAAQNGAGHYNLTLNAPSGTVFVTGSIFMSGVDGIEDGENAGSLTITAARIVITGTIDAHGESTVLAVTPGGNGGPVTLTATGELLVLGGTIISMGGTGTASGGGVGGNVDLDAGTLLALYGSVNGSGGAVNAATPTGGSAGNLTIDAGGAVEVFATVTLTGGTATGTTGALGGDGGDVSGDSTVVYRVYGTLNLQGGAATTSVSGTPTGGTGGSLILGTSNFLASAELGRGTWSTSGGSGGLSGGDGDSISCYSEDGDVVLGSVLRALGGAGNGTGNAAGGSGGIIEIHTDNGDLSTTDGNYTAHSLTVLSVASLATTGGAARGTANAGDGGLISLRSGADLTVEGSLNSAGGAAATGNGGSADQVTLTVASAGLAPATGDIRVSGSLTATGGGTTGGDGGSGSGVTLDATASSGLIVLSGAVDTSGADGAGLLGAGGASGNIDVSADFGDVTVSGNLTANAGDSSVTPGAAGAVTLTAGPNGGSVLLNSAIAANGGSSTALAATSVPGISGGAVTLEAQHGSGAVTISSSGSITSTGGAATGSAVTDLGGAGGLVQLRSADQDILINGPVTAMGGPNLSTGPGGFGGRLVVDSDTDTDGAGGDITLASGVTVNVSAGASTAGGSAIRDLTGGVTVGLVAVVFDADSGADSAAGGRVVNNGSILANGTGLLGLGGDVFFDGRDAAGAALPAAGSQSRSGTAGAGDFVPD